jgi:hypothetical protein
MSNTWVTLSGSIERDEPFTAKRLEVLPDRAIRQKHPYMMSVGWAYADEGSNRLPNTEELGQIAACEQALVDAGPTINAILVGALSSDGFHQFVLYVQDLTFAQIRVLEFIPKPLTEKATADIWNITGTLDESWNIANEIPIR